ncbi:MAG TPA: alpha/beta hydrolase [Candidatus Eremiobacteraceae bacterium]|nr:alpha/beta hydrolase [Candidatus Eremiobacteraceae bacterium]
MANLVFVHGSGHTHDSFAAQVAEFAGSDAVSLPGHPEGVALGSVGECADWLAKYLHWKGDGPAIVAGNSLGGAIAIEWALRYPADVAGLILLGSGARLKVAPRIFERIDDAWPACIDELIDLSVAHSAPASLRERIGEWHRAVGRESTRRDYANCDAWDAMDRVAAIAAPTLIVVGAEDRMTPPKYAQLLQQKIAGSSLELIEGAGHLAHAERPELVGAAIRRAFASVAA